MKQMNVRLTEELKKKVKIKLAEEDKSFNQVVVELLTKWIGEQTVQLKHGTVTYKNTIPKEEVKPLPGFFSEAQEAVKRKQ